MRQQEPELRGPISPIELIKQSPGEPFAASDRLRWVGMEALRYHDQPPNEAFQPPLTHHTLVLFIRTPKEFELQCDGVIRLVPPPAGSILVVPAGSPARWRWSGHSDSLHIFLEPGLVARVAAEAFDLDPARLTVPPLDGPGPPATPGRDVGGGCRADGRRRRGAARRRVPGQRSGCPPDPQHLPAPRRPGAGRTAHCRRGSSAPSSSTSRNTSTPA